MNWTRQITTAFLFTTALAVCAVTSAATEDLFRLRGLSVLTLPSADVTVEPEEDGAGIKLMFSRFSDATRQLIEDGLTDTDIEKRYLAGQGAAMTVVLFSKKGDLRTDLKVQHKTVQLIIGTIRPEVQAISNLLSPQSLVPLAPKLQRQLRAGELGKVRAALFATKVENDWERDLQNARVTVINAALRGGVAAECEPAPARIDHPEQIEAAILTIFCLNTMNRHQDAQTIMHQLETEVTDQTLIKRLAVMRQQFLLRTLLAANRNNDHETVAGTYLAHNELLSPGTFSIYLLETVAANLNRLGLGHLLAKMADRIMSALPDQMLAKAAPALAETYLNGGNDVRASDTASYFLDKRLPRWSRARLLRVRATVSLSEGNWSDAAADLKILKRLTPPTVADQLAALEANLRQGIPDLRTVKINGPDTPELRFLKKWASRLSLEQTLYQKKMPSPEKLITLPDHVIFLAAQSAKDAGWDKRALALTKVLAGREGAWAKLAQSDLVIYDAEQQIKRIEQEVLQ